MKLNILLTCVGGSFSPGTISAIRSLEFAQFTIVGVDCSADPVGKYFCDAFYQVPAGDAPQYFDRIQEIILKEKIDFVIPTSDEEALTLSEKKELLANHAKLACSDFKTLKILSNKIETYLFLQKHNIKVPEFIAINNIGDLQVSLENSLEKWKDFVIKPAVSRGARDVVIISEDKISPDNDRIICLDKKDLKLSQLNHIFEGKFPLLITQRFEGTVCDLDLLGNNGEAVTVISRKRIIGSRPDSGHIIFKNESLYELGKQLIAALKLTWLYDCDFMFDEAGNPSILEINPRQSGSIAVTHAANLPIIENLMRMALDLPIENKGQVTKDIKVIPYISFKEI